MSKPAGPKETLSRNLLIVEDEIDLRELLSEDLQSTGWQVEVAHNGLQGYEMAATRSEHWDIILSDIQMPKLTGLGMLEKLNREGLSIPLVFLTAFGEREKAKKALMLGAYDFISKPYQLDNLDAVLLRALDYSRLLREAKIELLECQDWLSDQQKSSPEFMNAKKELLQMGKELKNLRNWRKVG